MTWVLDLGIAVSLWYFFSFRLTGIDLATRVHILTIESLLP